VSRSTVTNAVAELDLGTKGMPINKRSI